MKALSPVLLNILKLIAEVTKQEQGKIHLVGGFVRDYLMGRDTNDIDFTVDGDALKLAKIVASNLSGTVILLNELNTIVRVIVNMGDYRWQLDFAPCAGRIEDNMLKRDFTINALAIELNNFINAKQELIDPTGGEVDLRNGQIKAVSSAVFNEDPVRLLRAVRIAAELYFQIESNTADIMRKQSALIKSVAGERLRSELVRILKMRSAVEWLKQMDNLNLLTEIFPELIFTRGVDQPKEHYWDVFNHSLQTVGAVEFLLGEGIWHYGGNYFLEYSCIRFCNIMSHLDEYISADSNRKVLLKLGALLHDIAKPQTKLIDSKGRVRFYGHSKQGALIVDNIMSRLRFSNKEISTVKKMVAFHLRPVQMANVGLPSNRAVYRFFRDAGDDGLDILLLALGDYLAARGPNLYLAEWKQLCSLTAHIIGVHTIHEKTILPTRLITGDDIMKLFSLTSGPLVGKLLSLVREAQAIGEIKTREDAVTFIMKELAISIDENK